MIADPEEYARFLGILKAIGIAPSTIPCSRGSKIPAVKWGHLKPGESVESYPSTRARLLLTGSRSGGIVVVDADDVKVFEDLERRLGPLPGPDRTLTVRSPSGKLHVYLRSAVPISNVVGADGRFPPKGIDLRGEGGVVMCPGSEHPNGGIYRIESE